MSLGRTPLLLLAFALAAAGPARAAEPPPLVLISLDAFRWDYCALHPEQTPRLRELAREGVSARALIPVYPSNTFPNHTSIATGLYPAHHGIVNNEFFDPALGEFFHYNVDALAKQSRWWGGEPIWVTAVKQGLKSACSVWPGCGAAIGGVRPTYSIPFTTLDQVHDEKRVGEVVHWLTLPPDQRPSVVLFYWEEGNATGHKYGPGSPQIADTIALLDRRIGEMVDSLKQAGVAANLIVVSDHGMTDISPERVLVLEDYLAPGEAQVDFHNPEAGLRPLKGSAEDLVRKLSAMPHARVCLARDLPARLHLSGNPRIPPVWILPDEGWEVQPRAYFEKYRAIMNKGDHGYDPAYPPMRGIFIAEGPSFRHDGAVLDPFENIEIYNLMCAALGLRPAPNDGDDRLVREVMLK